MLSHRISFAILVFALMPLGVLQSDVFADGRDRPRPQVRQDTVLVVLDADCTETVLNERVDQLRLIHQQTQENQTNGQVSYKIKYIIPDEKAKNYTKVKKQNKNEKLIVGYPVPDKLKNLGFTVEVQAQSDRDAYLTERMSGESGFQTIAKNEVGLISGDHKNRVREKIVLSEYDSTGRSKTPGGPSIIKKAYDMVRGAETGEQGLAAKRAKDQEAAHEQVAKQAEAKKALDYKEETGDDKAYMAKVGNDNTKDSNSISAYRVYYKDEKTGETKYVNRTPPAESIPLDQIQSPNCKSGAGYDAFKTAYSRTVRGVMFTKAFAAGTEEGRKAPNSVTRDSLDACASNDECCIEGAKKGTITLSTHIGTDLKAAFDSKDPEKKLQANSDEWYCYVEFLEGVYQAYNDGDSLCKAKSTCSWKEPAKPFRFANCFQIGLVTTASKMCPDTLKEFALNKRSKDVNRALAGIMEPDLTSTTAADAATDKAVQFTAGRDVITAKGAHVD